VDKGHAYGALTDGVLEKSKNQSKKNLPSFTRGPLLVLHKISKKLGVGSYFILKEICIKPPELRVHLISKTQHCGAYNKIKELTQHCSQQM